VPRRVADRLRGVRLALLPLAALCALTIGACGDTLQDKPIPHNLLEGMIVAPFPVYWLGGSFQHLAITEVVHDPSGAFSVQYGDCLQGGQGTCTPPLRVVTSPDNSFLPAGTTPSSRASVRGVPVVLTQAGRAIALATGGVVVDVYAKDPSTALSAARGIVPINAPGAPGETLPARLPDTGFGSTPLPSQRPTAVRPPA
jgi:hypothetical protein